jgi:hypothetical protein
MLTNEEIAELSYPYNWDTLVEHGKEANQEIADKTEEYTELWRDFLALRAERDRLAILNKSADSVIALQLSNALATTAALDRANREIERLQRGLAMCRHMSPDGIWPAVVGELAVTV